MKRKIYEMTRTLPFSALLYDKHSIFDKLIKTKNKIEIRHRSLNAQY